MWRAAAVSGDLAYVGDGQHGLQVIDVSDAANPTIIGAVDAPGYAHEAAVADDVADGAFGLQVIDVSDPANPTIGGEVDTQDQARGVSVSRDVAYVGDGSIGFDDLMTLLTEWGAC